MSAQHMVPCMQRLAQKRETFVAICVGTMAILQQQTHLTHIVLFQWICWDLSNLHACVSVFQLGLQQLQSLGLHFTSLPASLTASFMIGMINGSAVQQSYTGTLPVLCHQQILFDLLSRTLNTDVNGLFCHPVRSVQGITKPSYGELQALLQLHRVCRNVL